MKKNLAALLISSSLLLLLLAGCARETAPAQQTTAAETTAAGTGTPGASAAGESTAEANPSAAEGSNSTFTYAISGDTGNTINPLLADDRFGLMTMHLTFSPLYYIYPDGTVEYILAESMTLSEDGLVYTLKLKDGLKWNDGEALTADDVIFTFETHNNQSENLYVAGEPITVEKADDLTVLFKLPSVSASAFEMLSAEMSILPKHIFEGKNSFDVNMLEEPLVGSGPYKLEEYKTGQYLKFAKNPFYALGEPRIETIVLRIIENNDTASLALQSKEIDAWIGLPDLLAPFEAVNDFKVYNYSEGRVAYLRLNPKTESMKDKEYRKGILYALDRSEIMLAAYSDPSFYQLSYSFLPPTNKFYSDDVERWEQDLEKAKALTENGPKSLKILHIEDNSVLTNQALVVQHQLSNIGIQAELVGVNQAAFIKVAYDKTNTEYDILFGGYVMGVDPETYAMLFVSGTDNMMVYDSKEVDELFASGNTTLEDARRMEIYKELQRKVSEEAIFYPFGSNLRTLVTSSRLGGIEEAGLVPIYTFGDWGKLQLE